MIAEDYNKLRYGVTDIPPWTTALFFGFQVNRFRFGNASKLSFLLIAASYGLRQRGYFKSIDNDKSDVCWRKCNGQSETYGHHIICNWIFNFCSIYFRDKV